MANDHKEPMSQVERIEAIKGFWNDQAQAHGADLAATTPDPIAKDLEVAALMRHLDPNKDTLEIGCGNGTNIFRLADHLGKRILGIDYAEHMVEAANKTLQARSPEDRARIRFAAGDITESRDLAREYQSLYPNGRRAKAVAKFGGLD